jgi:transcriptional regulator with XRE-family HTH domain
MRLKAWLEKTGTTQETFAEMIDTTQETVSRLARGHIGAGFETLLAIEQATGDAVRAQDVFDAWKEAQERRTPKASAA